MEGLLSGVVFQNNVAAAAEPAFLVRGGDTAAGVGLPDAVPEHQPGHPVLQGSGDGYGDVTKLIQATLKQANGINGCQGRLLFQPATSSGCIV